MYYFLISSNDDTLVCKSKIIQASTNDAIIFTKFAMTDENAVASSELKSAVI